MQNSAQALDGVALSIYATLIAGPVEGKPLVWSVSDGLIPHGSYNITPAATDGDGKGVANWQTVDETTPKSQRTFTNQRDAVGAAIVRAGSLVPGWSGLERIVGLLKDTGNTGDAPITVIYYRLTLKRVDGTYWDAYHLTGAIYLENTFCAAGPGELGGSGSIWRVHVYSCGYEWRHLDLFRRNGRMAVHWEWHIPAGGC